MSLVFTEVSPVFSGRHEIRLIIVAGIGPKLVQSVLTAAFLFAFKDVLYDVTVKARARVAAKAAA